MGPQKGVVGNLRLLIATGLLVSIYAVVLQQYATIQPEHSGGVPIVLWASLLVIPLAGTLLGSEVSERITSLSRGQMMVAQLIVTLLLFTPLIGLAWLLNIGYFDLTVVRNWYAVLLVVGVVVVSISHLLDYVLNNVLAVQSTTE
jgi:hypothetical protein